MSIAQGVQPEGRDIAAIRDLLAQYGHLQVDVRTLSPNGDLYLAGLTSLATVNIMLALESHFEIEFPNSMLSRRTFATLRSIAEAVAELAR